VVSVVVTHLWNRCSFFGVGMWNRYSPIVKKALILSFSRVYKLIKL
jgi:hypothetical protein